MNLIMDVFLLIISLGAFLVFLYLLWMVLLPGALTLVTELLERLK